MAQTFRIQMRAGARAKFKGAVKEYLEYQMRIGRPLVAGTAVDITNDAKQNAEFSQGYQTGTLRSQIHPEFKGLTAFVVSPVDHGAFVELGTGRRGASSSHPELPKGYRHGPTAGQAAQPYLFPAVEKNVAPFRAGVIKNLQRVP